jgi:tripartite-type tricarboxylate transporter receptor subunit TctC
VIYEHRAGAGGSLGAQHVAQATDNHSFLITSSSIATLPAMRRDPGLDPLTDLQPVTLVTDAPLLISGRPNGPADLAAYLARAKANPGKLSWGSSGVGSATHLAGALLMQRAGIELLHVPYRGATLAMNALLAGDIDSIITDVSIPLEHLRAGTLRPIGVTSAARAPLLADVPAIIEQVPRYTVPFWFALMAPKAMPPEPIARLLAELAPLAMPSSELSRRMAERGSQLLLNGPAPLAARLREEIPQWREVVAAAGIQPE